MFFFNDTATTEIYTLSLHDALPILFSDRDAVPARDTRVAHSVAMVRDGRILIETGGELSDAGALVDGVDRVAQVAADRKSTRLNSSHANISYAVFCLKKKNELTPPP